MVYHGPSSGCLTCRRRKIKCDENDPCRRCTRRGLVCPGLPSVAPPRRGFQSTDSGSNPLEEDLTSSYEPRHDVLLGSAEINRDDEARQADKNPPEDCFYDESTTSTLGLAQAVAPLQTLPATSWKEVSIASYLAFTSADKRDSNPWITMVVEPDDEASHDCIYFDDALAAVSLLRMAKEPHLVRLRQQAAICHGRALRLLRNALTRADGLASDRSLLAVRLCITYVRVNLPTSKVQHTEGADNARNTLALTDETKSIEEQFQQPQIASPPSPLGRKPAMPTVDSHVDGLLYIVLARGPRQMQANTSYRLFQSVRENVIFNYSARCKRVPVSKEQPSWQWFFDSPATDPADKLINIASDLPQLRNRACSLYGTVDHVNHRHDLEELKADAYTLLARLQDWHDGLPHDWTNPCIVPLTATEPAGCGACDYPSVGHLYPDPMITMVIGRYQLYSIMLLQVITTCVLAEIEHGRDNGTIDLERSRIDEHKESLEKQQAMVDAICAGLAVYSLSGDTFYELGKPTAGGLQHGGHFMPPILTSQSVQSVGARQRRYLVLKMEQLLGRPVSSRR